MGIFPENQVTHKLFARENLSVTASDRTEIVPRIRETRAGFSTLRLK